jgi:hypothetical protein
MPSTYSPLKIELPATGEQSGTWGNTTNTNLGTALEEAIVGSADVTFTNGNDTTVTLTDSNASQVARNLRLNLIGSSNAAQSLILGSGCQIEKLYLVNNTLGHDITVKNTTGTGIVVPAGKTMFVYNNGTNVVEAINSLVTLDVTTLDATNIEVTNIKAKDGTASATIANSTGVMTVASSVLTTTDINGGTIDNTAIGASTPAAGTFTQVDIVAQGDLRLQDTTGGQFVALQAPGTIATSYTLTLPVDDGTSGQALITDGSGVLSWSTAAAGDVYGPASATDNAIARFDLTTGKIIQNSVVTIADSTGNMAGVGTISSGAITSSSLTSGRVLYAGASGLIQDDADFTFNGTTVTMTNDASISGLTVGKGAGAVSTNTAIGASALAGNSTGAETVAVGRLALNANTASNNTAVGFESLKLNTSGTSNAAFGGDSLGSNTTGSQNTGVGWRALRFTTTGSFNTALGTQALFNNTTASNNTAVGFQAGFSNTTGAQLTAFGQSALKSNTTGSESVAVGNAALFSNTFGANNVAMGSGALLSNTTASFNTAVGHQAAYSNTIGTGLVALGSTAAYSNTTGTGNVAVGNSTLFSNTFGSSNVAVGPGAMTFNTTGSNNTAQGFQSLYSNTTASNNTAVGYQAGYSNTTGTAIVAVGYEALKVNTTGINNVALGLQALRDNTTSSNNTAVGHQALVFSTGATNTAVGSFALFSNTTASNNTAVGYQALYANTTGTNNIAVGYRAGYTVVTGTDNTYLGRQAGILATGSLNVMIGSDAGYNSTGSSNTFVGAGVGGGVASGNAMTSGSKNTLIGGYNGNQDGLDIRTASNYAVIADGDGNRLISTANGQTLALDSAVPNSGTGITFPATQSASSDANTLDDYEEGTWTVTFFDAASAGNASATTATGYYTKVGNRVNCNFQIDNISTSGMTAGNTLYFTLPFTAADNTSGVASWENIDLAANYTSISASTSTSSARAYFLVSGDNNGYGVTTVANVTTGAGDFRVNITYRV